MDRLTRGAEIVIGNWVRLRPWQKLLIITSREHRDEAEALRCAALKRTRKVELMIVENTGIKTGVFFDENENILLGYSVIIGATDYSLVTTKAAKKAIQKGRKFLSLPLSTNDARPMLSYDFLTMDTKKSKYFARVIMKYLNASSVVRITSRNGTDLRVYKRNRRAGFFNGVIRDGRGYSSASIEVYVPIEETKSEGVMVVDGSLGYIGKAEVPTRVQIAKGRICEIEDTAAGRRLREYLDSYEDDRVLFAANRTSIWITGRLCQEARSSRRNRRSINDAFLLSLSKPSSAYVPVHRGRNSAGSDTSHR